MQARKFHLSIVLTNQCNLNCVYCYESHKAKHHIEEKKVKDIITEYLNSPLYEEVEIDFFGGEPFLEFDTIKNVCEWVWTRQWKNKYIFFATTNGVLVQGEIKEWLRQHKRGFWCCLSLDGTRDSHNTNRSNSFDKIDIAFFKECWPKQTVKMTISKETVEHIYENIVFIHSLGFEITGTNFAEGIDWENEKYIKIVASQLEKLVKFYIEHPELKSAPIVNMAIHKCADTKEPRKWCGCGEHMVAYETDGKKYPCTFFTPMTFSKNILEDVLKKDFADYDAFVDKDCYENCYLEPVCNCCYGANLLSNNKINKRDRSKCALTKIRAVYSAALRANKILTHPEDTYENKLAIQAINKINELYNIQHNPIPSEEQTTSQPTQQ